MKNNCERLFEGGFYSDRNFEYNWRFPKHLEEVDLANGGRPGVSRQPAIAWFVLPHFYYGCDYTVQVVEHSFYLNNVALVNLIEKNFVFTNVTIFDAKVVAHEIMHVLLYHAMPHFGEGGCLNDEQICDLGIDLLQLGAMNEMFHDSVRHLEKMHITMFQKSLKDSFEDLIFQDKR